MSKFVYKSGQSYHDHELHLTFNANFWHWTVHDAHFIRYPKKALRFDFWHKLTRSLVIFLSPAQSNNRVSMTLVLTGVNCRQGDCYETREAAGGERSAEKGLRRL